MNAIKEQEGVDFDWRQAVEAMRPNVSKAGVAYAQAKCIHQLL